MQVGPKKVLNTAHPKNIFEGPKKIKNGPKSGQIKNKKIEFCFKNQYYYFTLAGAKKFLNLIVPRYRHNILKIAPKKTKKAKKAKLKKQ